MRDYDVTFSPIRLEDVQAVSDMSRRIWQQHYLPDILTESELEYFWQRAYAPARLQAHMDSGVCYEWINAGASRVGFLAYGSEPAEHRLHLSKLYLEPAFHGCGIGSRALRRVQQHGYEEGLKEVTLYVFRGNDKAIRAYARAGFSVERTEMTECGKGYRYDDYVMIYQIPSREGQETSGRPGPP